LARQAVGRGETYLAQSSSHPVAGGYLAVKTQLHRPSAQLTPHQREILQLIAEGKTTKEIAFLLNLSVKTVETHRAQLMERLAIRDVAGLVRYALRTGLVPPEG